MSKKIKSRKSLATRSVRAGIESDAQYGSVVPPIYLSSNFAFEGYRRPRKYDYTRSGNPTRDQLGAALADLEGGAGAVVTCTGMAAITLVVATLAPGARVLAPFDCYGGTYRLLAALHAQGKLVVDFVDQGDAAALGAALAAGPQLVWIETPSNPLLRIVDIRAIAEAAHARGALVAADNTFLSPLWQQPLALGADLVMHSTTKYLNGHSDVVGGAVIAATPELAESLSWWANAIGVTGAPFDSFLSLRGVRTLHARMRVHAENTAAVVDLLHRHPAVRQVFYPGLADHPGHELARRQQSGFGAMLSCRVQGRRARGGGVSRRTRVLHARRVARRGGELGRASGQHDARGHGRSGPQRWPGSGRGCCACRSESRMPRTCSRTSPPASSAPRRTPLQRSQNRICRRHAS